MLLLVLARRPRLLVLDEPTSGLDPVARHEMLAELMDVLKDEERSILFSSHNTLDIEQISDQITFIPALPSIIATRGPAYFTAEISPNRIPEASVIASANDRAVGSIEI
jgi:ABC-type Na+ transport system ATPase subunit NatA